VIGLTSAAALAVHKDKLKAVLRASLPLVAQRLQQAPATRVQRTLFVREGDDRARFPVVEEFDVRSSLLQTWSLIEVIPEIEALRQTLVASDLSKAMLVDAGRNAIENAESQKHWLMNHFVLPVLYDYVGESIDCDWDEQRASEACLPLEEFLRREGITWRFVAPLGNAVGETLEFTFSENLRLRVLVGDELQRLWDESEFGGGVSRLALMQLKFCLELVLQTGKTVEVDRALAQRILADLATSLRLAGAEKITAPWLLRDSVERTYGPESYRTLVSSSDSGGHGTSTLDLVLCERASGIFNRLGKLQGKRNIALAIQRFNFATQRLRLEDALIDSWIALEAIFLPEAATELSYRVSLRVAYFLSSSSDERLELFRRVRASYEERSRIAHGEEPKDLQNVAEFTVSTLRQALLKVLDEPEAVSSNALNSLVLGIEPTIGHDEPLG